MRVLILFFISLFSHAALLAQELRDDIPQFIELFIKKDQLVSQSFRSYLESEELDTVHLYTDGYRYFEEVNSHIFVARVNDRIDSLASYVFFQLSNDSTLRLVGGTPLRIQHTEDEDVYFYGSYQFNAEGFSLCTHTKVVEKGIVFMADPLSVEEVKRYKYPSDYIRYEHNCMEKYFANGGRLAARMYSDSTHNDWNYEMMKKQDKESLFFGMQSLYAKYNLRFTEEFLFRYFSTFNWYDPINENVDSSFSDRERILLTWLNERLSE